MKNIKMIIITFVCTIIMMGQSIQVYAANKINDSKVIKQYTTLSKSNVYEYDNGATIVMNDNTNVYELFIPELGDWSYICDSKQDLFVHLNMYNNSKDNVRDWENDNVKMSTQEYDDRIEYSLSNGIDIIKIDQSYQIYIPAMEDICFKLTNKNDVRNLVLTYLENTNK